VEKHAAGMPHCFAIEKKMTTPENKIYKKSSSSARFFTWAAILFFIALLIALVNVDINHHYE